MEFTKIEYYFVILFPLLWPVITALFLGLNAQKKKTKTVFFNILLGYVFILAVVFFYFVSLLYIIEPFATWCFHEGHGDLHPYICSELSLNIIIFYRGHGLGLIFFTLLPFILFLIYKWKLRHNKKKMMLDSDTTKLPYT